MEFKILETMLTKKNAIVIDKKYMSKDTYPAAYALSFGKNIESLGFSPSMELLEQLRHVSPVNLGKLSETVVPILEKMVGAHVKYSPMFKNFPESVMNAEEGELLWKQLLGYISDSIQIYSGLDVRRMISFDGEKEERSAAVEKPKFKVISLGTEDDFDNLARNTIAGKSSISSSDKEWVEWALINRDVMPDDIPNKETLAFVSGVIINNNLKKEIPFKTCTDVLRIAVALSNGDISLATNTRFKSFSRKERRFLWNAFEKVFTTNRNAYEELQKRSEVFARLSERIHPVDYEKIAPTATSKFRELQKGLKVATFESQLEAALASGDLDKSISLLKKRPGVFARRIDQVLRLATATNRCNDVLCEFSNVADQVSTPVLWSILNYLDTRDNEKRVVFPKGSISNAYAYDSKLTELPRAVEVNLRTLLNNTLMKTYSKQGSLAGKKVYIDKELENFTVPSAVRSASRALRTVGRGSKINISENVDCIRSFVYWKGSGVDLDLSAVMLNEDFQRLYHISYTNLTSGRGDECFACHSGDITSAPKGDSEFIDVSLSRLSKYLEDCKYIAFIVNSYSEIGFNKLEEVFFGLQERAGMNNKGEVYEPKTVKFKFDLAGDALVAIPIIFDVENKCFIWSDIESMGSFNFANNVEQNTSSISAAVRGMVENKKTNLYDLFTTNCLARGATLIPKKEYEVSELDDNGEEIVLKKKADLIFSYDEGITPFDGDVILAEYF